MKISLNWLKTFINFELENESLKDLLTDIGLEVEGEEIYESLPGGLKGLVVAEVLTCVAHPDADKLIICQVNLGKEKLQIVTGASNVKVGDKVPVVVDGGKVAGGHDGGPLPEDGIVIKNGKLRGIESYGMMCSIEELGSDCNMYPEAPENGIYIFHKEVKPGDDAIEALGLREDRKSVV